MSENEEFDALSPENFPKAAQILADEFYWDCTDDNSPFGNDSGADTLTFFLEWRKEHPRASPLTFLRQLLRNWRCVDDHWEVIQPEQIEALFHEDDIGPLWRDDVIVAIAFAQILLGEKMNAVVKERALLAIQRQALPFVVEFRGWSNLQQRTDRLKKMEAVLIQQPTTIV